MMEHKEGDDRTLDEVLEALEADPDAFDVEAPHLDPDLDMEVSGVEVGPQVDGYQSLTMKTNRGDITCRYYGVADAIRAVIWVGGVGGDFDTPARDLYPRLCEELTGRGVASLRVQFRDPVDLEEAVLDTLAGIGYLLGEGMERLALVGHSFGGAVVIQAGTASEAVRGVVTLATQSYGADVVDELPKDCALLAIHGTADTVLPAVCSRYVYQHAHEPKQLVLHEGAGHVLDEAADAVEREVRAFILDRLGVVT